MLSGSFVVYFNFIICFLLEGIFYKKDILNVEFSIETEKSLCYNFHNSVLYLYAKIYIQYGGITNETVKYRHNRCRKNR